MIARVCAGSHERSSVIYLDHNATAPLRPEVLEAVLPALRDHHGNPSSLCSPGREAKRHLEHARAEVADALGAEPGEIVFTSGGTEADNLALRGPLSPRVAPGTRRLVVSAVEHPAVLRPSEALAEEGVRVERLGVDHEGRVSVDALAALLAAEPAETTLVSVMLANNDVGTLQPVRELAAVAHARGALIHSDAVQAVGRVDVRVGALGVDLLSLSGHKLGAPPGAGALYVRRGLALAPLLLGGEQERGRRAGTENLPAVLGLGRACALACAERDAEAARLEALRDRLERGVLALAPEAVVHGAGAPRLANTLNLSLPGVSGEALLMNLDLEGIAVSTGSACASGQEAPSHVLLAMGVPEALARSSLRFSLGRTTTAEEIDATLAALAALLPRLREAARG
jgi:cysteine desulfurase